MKHCKLHYKLYAPNSSLITTRNDNIDIIINLVESMIINIIYNIYWRFKSLRESSTRFTRHIA